MTLHLPTLLDVARRVTQQAENHLRDHRPGRVTAKAERDMVTDVDIAIEQLVRTLLLHETPGIEFLGEEEGGPGEAETLWVLDPIDGTANYVRDLPLCGVSLALVHQGRPVLGLIVLPFLDRRYWAADGLGAWRDGRPIAAARTSDLRDAVVAVGDYGTGPDVDGRNRAALALHAALAPTVQRVRMLGSAAVDLALVADGTLDASFTLGNRPWDMAAGVVIARVAGAHVTDIDGTDHTRDSTATIATAPALRNSLHPLIRTATANTPYDPDGRNAAPC